MTRDRDRANDHEAAWARELDVAQDPRIERLAQNAEAELRGDGASLAEVRSEWAEFDRENPMEGDAIHRDFVRAKQLAYARVVDDLLRQEAGEGLRERHAPRVDDEFEDLLAGRPSQRAEHLMRDDSKPDAPSTPSPRTGPERSNDHNTDARNLSPAPRLTEAERKLVEAEANERIARPPPGGRPSEVPPVDWYLARAQALDARSQASVDREVGRLKDLPQLSTRQAAADAVARTASDFERDRDAGVDNAKLRTRLYALALVHDLRVREEAERLLDLPVAPPLPERSGPADRSPPLEHTSPARPLPVLTAGRELTVGSEPRVRRFVLRDGTDPREQEEARTIPDATVIPSSGVFARVSPPRDLSPRAETVTYPGRKNVRAPGPRFESDVLEVSTADVLGQRDASDGTDRGEDPSLNTRLSDRFRERSAALERQLASVASAADREYLSLARDAENDAGAARELQEVASAKTRIEAAGPQSHDPYDLSAKVNELAERERNEPDLTDGRLRAERLAYGELAREAFVRRNSLLKQMTEDRLAELSAMEPAERKAFADEAVLLLQEPSYNDRGAMNRELLRSDTDRLAQHAALARAVPSFTELGHDAKWRGPDFHERVDARVKDRLMAEDRDGELLRALADARVRSVLEDGMLEKRRARDEALELAEVLRRLPIARSLDIDTPPSARFGARKE